MIAPRPILLVCAAVASLSAAPAQASAEGGLLPYQMVRSLQLVQDRIAGGDHAALPMQRKLLEMTDARLRSTSAEEFADPRNFRALLIYAMSGGNPNTVSDLLARLEVGETERLAGAAILSYLRGEVGPARAAMARIEPAAHPEELAAFLYLVKGSVLGAENAGSGIPLLDRARLLGPGTLVEEAALRRAVALAVTARKAETFMAMSERYARRFLRSPYSSQFAESFISGILELKGSLDMNRVEEAIAWMTPEQAKTVYLRLARRSAIDGDTETLAFASERARHYEGVDIEAGDPRSELYSSISSVTSETVEQVLSQLRDLDPKALSKGDRALLRAARVVAAEVIAPVPAPVAAVPDFVAPDFEPEDVGLEDSLDPSGPAGPAIAATNGEPPPMDATDQLVVQTRSRLEAIDQLLEETKE